MSTHPSLAIANYFIRKATEGGGAGIDPLKLQKLIYFAHGWHLAITGRPLLNEPVEAWTYGPVVPTDNAFKAYGGDLIDFPTRKLDSAGFPYAVPEEDSETLAILDRVWVTYQHYSGLELSAMTHEAGSPWAKTRDEAEGEGLTMGKDIPNSLIRDAFTRMALDSRQAA